MTGNPDVATVGCGNISDSHIKSWKNVVFTVVVVWDRDISLAESKAETMDPLAICHIVECLRAKIYVWQLAG